MEREDSIKQVKLILDNIINKTYSKKDECVVCMNVFCPKCIFLSEYRRKKFDNYNSSQQENFYKYTCKYHFNVQNALSFIERKYPLEYFEWKIKNIS